MNASSAVKSVMMTSNRTQVIRLEACIAKGFSGIQLLGNLGETCKEGRERAKTALENLGIQLTQKRVLINLSPADLKKEGNHFDLPLAVLLAKLHRKACPQVNWERWALVGELDLEGRLGPIHGCTAMVLGALDSHLEGIVIPKPNLGELASLAPLIAATKLQVLGFDSLQEILDWQGGIPLSLDKALQSPTHVQFDFDDMSLSKELRELIVCTIAGRHHLLLMGAPGCGKSMLAERLPSLMRPLELHDLKDVLKVYGLSREALPDRLLATCPPFRQPHHSLSPQALLGTPDRAGEVSLAHMGLLFLDEFPEFRRDAIEALREPLETGHIHVSRAREKASWLARPQLVAAANPCPCGWFGSKLEACRCTTQQLLRYQSKMSGPIMDRIDIHYIMPEAAAQRWQGSSHFPGQTEDLRNEANMVMEVAFNRNSELGVKWNRELGFQHFPLASGHTESGLNQRLDAAAIRVSSRRSLLKVLRVARTLADLAQSATIESHHLRQAWKWHQPLRLLDQGMP